MPDLAIREETVDCVLLVVEYFEDRCQLGQDQQLYVTLGQMQELKRPTLLLKRGEADNHRAETCAVDKLDSLQVQNDVEPLLIAKLDHTLA